MLLQKKIEKRKRRSFQIGPATPGEVSGTKKRDIFLEKNPVKTVENYIFHCNQAKENIAKERAERGSKSKKDDSPEAEVGGKRPRQQAKRSKATKPTTSSPSPPHSGFRMLLTGKNSDSEEEEDYPDSNARATYAHAKFARVLPPSQKKTSQLEVEPRPRAGQVKTRTHQQMMEVAIDSLQLRPRMHGTDKIWVRPVPTGVV